MLNHDYCVKTSVSRISANLACSEQWFSFDSLSFRTSVQELYKFTRGVARCELRTSRSRDLVVRLSMKTSAAILKTFGYTSVGVSMSRSMSSAFCDSFLFSFVDILLRSWPHWADRNSGPAKSPHEELYCSIICDGTACSPPCRFKPSDAWPSMNGEFQTSGTSVCPLGRQMSGTMPEYNHQKKLDLPH